MDENTRELSDIGKRQMYLLGKQTHQDLSSTRHFISPQRKPSEVLLRSISTNTSIDALQSYYLGLYPPQEIQLEQNQTDRAKPLFKVQNESIESIMGSGQENLHIYSEKYDVYRPVQTCPVIQDEMRRRSNSSEVQSYLDKKYAQ